MALVGTRKPLLGNLLKHEYSGNLGYCRDVVTVNISGGADLSVGSVLGKVTATGKYVQRDPAGGDGSEVSAAVVVENKTVGDGVDADIAVLVRGPSVIAKEALVFDVTHTSGEKATAISEIEALGVVARKQV